MRKVILILLVLSLIFTGCSTARDSKNNQETNTQNPVDNQNAENPGIAIENREIHENADLTELTTAEKSIYDNFKAEYDNEVLRDLDPVVVAKFYLYADKTEDWGTQYELYIDDDNYVQWTKEEHLNFDRNIESKYLKEFKNVDVYFHYNDNGKEGAVRMVDKEFPYILMTKNNAGIWKINFLPGQ